MGTPDFMVGGLWAPCNFSKSTVLVLHVNPEPATYCEYGQLLKVMIIRQDNSHRKLSVKNLIAFFPCAARYFKG